ncbi:cytochrome C peroxidase [Photobacterium angustum]|uniref:cytochrome-c peroxidase n=1 Tax=Photobacterium angustum TaxID=661 RepID=UPI0005E73E63|nr:cytochrome c peroxidase [Photobacterium angustum]KJG07867.1 cytochrome C peroxidase [Photobacterium angustum]PSV94803.1 cytochrome-c peroxidase [Photobacterium angustum]PSW78818.1 cytochrome-c peroxidase [Photobacterium angustum]
MRTLLTFLSLIVLVFIPCSALAKTSEQQAQITLGRYLFNDVRLSKLGNRSCALCHAVDLGWTNRFSKVPDIHGNPTTLNTPALLNVAHYGQFMQSREGLQTLEQAILLPLFGTTPTEMGMTEPLLIQRLQQASDIYTPLFEASYQSADFTTQKVIDALAKYVETIQSVDTPYHRYLSGDTDALNKEQQLGLALFNSDRLKCSQCHGGELLNTPKNNTDPLYVSTGLYGIKNKDGKYLYPENERGKASFSHKESDDGKYRIPSLINVSETAPWGHDGSVQSLEQYIEHYAAGGRILTIGKNTGDGRYHLNKDNKISGFSLSNKEKKALVAFLNSLTITRLPAQQHQDPFCQLVPLKNKKDSPNCLPPFKVKS